jgi:hypothetical protein
VRTLLIGLVMVPLLVVGAWAVRFELQPMDESSRRAFAVAGVLPTVVLDRWTGTSAGGGGITTTSHALSVVAMSIALVSGGFALWLVHTSMRRWLAGSFLLLICILWVSRFSTIENRELLDRWSGVVSLRMADTVSPSLLPPPYIHSVASAQATPIPEVLTVGASAAMLVLTVFVVWRDRRSSS